MGYVLPVDNYQYQQYQNRVNQPKFDPYQIEKLYPPQFKTAYNHQEKLVYDTAHENSDMKQAESPTRDQAVINRIYAELTGKGQYLNEVV